MIHDSEMMVRSYVRSTLTELESFLLLLSYDRKAPEDRAISKSLFKSDMLGLGEKCFPSLCRLLDEYPQQHCQDITLQRYVKMIFPASAYVSGISTPTLDWTTDADAVIIESKNSSFL